MLKGDSTRLMIRNDTFKRNTASQLLRHCFEWLQPCYAKNRRCDSSRVTSITLT